MFIEWHYTEKKTTQLTNPTSQFVCRQVVTHKTLSQKCSSILLHKSTNFREKITKNRNWWFCLTFFSFENGCWRNIGRLIANASFFHNDSLFSFSLHRSLTFIRCERKKHSVYLSFYICLCCTPCAVLIVFLAIYKISFQKKNIPGKCSFLKI